MNKLISIIKHEFRQIARGKIFLIMTLLGPVLFGAMIFLPAYFAVQASEVQENTAISVYSENPEFIEILKERIQDSGLILHKAATEEEGKEMVISGKSAGFLSLPSDLTQTESVMYYSSTGTDYQNANELEDGIRGYVDELKGNQLGLSAEEQLWLLNKVHVETLQLADDGTTSSSGFESAYFIITALAVLIMMTVLIYGMTSARSVIAEKSSKTIELLLSSVPPQTIMLGKALGAGLAGLLQFSVWMLMGWLAAAYASDAMPISPGLLTPANLLILFVLFSLGFFFYILMYTAVGANTENEQNLGQAGMPLQICMMVPLITLSGIIANPDGTFATVLSYIPFTAPTAMGCRLLINSPGPGAIALSMGILALSLVVVLKVSSDVFKLGILHKGKSIPLPQLLKSLMKKDS